MCPLVAPAQTQKHATTKSYFWLGSVNTFRFDKHWGVIADFHFRAVDFLAHPYNYITRVQGNYWFSDRISAGTGFAHTWSRSSPTSPFANENRVTEQIQANWKKGSFSFSNRWRLEQRWQQKIINGAATDDYRFTNRVRYAVMTSYTPFNNPRLPSFTNYDELMVQFGKEVTYNTFDQCRVYFGIRQTITSQVNVDLGYLYFYQQQFTGNQYIKGNTLRLYINYTFTAKDKVNKNTSAFVEQD